MSSVSAISRKISKTSAKSHASKAQSEEASQFPTIKCMDDVINNFFNQIVQYVIEDMIILEENEPIPLDKSKSDEIVKDYKDLKSADLSNAQIKSVSGSKVTLTRRSSSGGTNKKGGKNSKESMLDIIKEETSERPSATSTTLSSLQDPLMEEERNVKIIFTNGNIYEGKIFKRIMNGQGRYYWTDGTVYEGEFKDGFPTGKGKMVLPDLSHYEGEFNQGLFNGHGFLNIVSTPTFYNGQWKNGLKHGQGWVLYEPGDWYEGSWANDLKDGFGIRFYKNGGRYRGTWREGKYDGQGTMIWENNDYYKGEWCKGLMHGQGEYIWNAFYNNTFAFPIQNIYRGSWEKGKRHGEGTMLFGHDSGLKLVGRWDQDFKHGEGVLICGSGRVIQQDMLFNYDKPVKLNPSAWSIRSNLLYQVRDVPIFYPPENVDLGFYVDKILAKLKDIDGSKLNMLKNFEEKHVKNIITRHLPQLRELYKYYASIASKTPLHYEPVLIRFFLWQMYKDMDISKRGISLADSDNILAENPQSCVDTVHYPFEPIYFWQFLMSLVGIALTTCSLEETCDNSIEGGVSACIIKHFFDEIVFAKPLNHQSSFLFNFLDLAPIKAVYALYKKIGEPHSARTFLKQSCTKKGEIPPLCLLQLNFQKTKPQFGTNLVPLDENITFAPQNEEELDDRLKHTWTNLFDFRHLGPRNIVRCLAKSCPLIMEEDLVVNIDYPLTFLEFYETVLTLIFMVLELEMKREHKNVSKTVSPSATQSNLSKPRSVKRNDSVMKTPKKGKKQTKKKKKKAA